LIDRRRRHRAPAVRARLEWLLFRLGPAGRGRAIGLLSVWLLVQLVTDRLFHLREVRPGGLMFYSLHRYAGPPVQVDDRCRVERSDWVLTPHLNNRGLARALTGASGRDATLRRTWWSWTAVSGEFAALAGALARDEITPRPVALTAVTLMTGPMARIGFVAQPYRGRWERRFQGFFLRGLLVVYHPAGLGAWRHIARLEPAEMWMATDQFVRRHSAGRRALDAPRASRRPLPPGQAGDVPVDAPGPAGAPADGKASAANGPKSPDG
jgi:hypothetical protein